MEVFLWLLAMVLFFVGLCRFGEPSTTDKVRKKITDLLEGFNSRYPHDRLNLDEIKLTVGRRSFSVSNEAEGPVIEVQMVSDDNVIVTKYNMRSTMHFGKDTMEELLLHIDEFLHEYHQYHVVECHQYYPHPA